ncbi:MAG: DUF4263 domain-containing protein [Anaerolineae bacterium]|nr:DUF4263 domain-containing protein [Anaerolineae bacterium]
MSDRNEIDRARKLFADLIDILNQLTDAQVGELFGSGILNAFMNAILEPSDVEKFPSVAAFFLANKWRASYIAAMQHALTRNYSFPIKRENLTAFASPSHVQWFDDGVMLLDAGTKSFAGLLALYRNERLSYAVAARDTKPGEQLVATDFEFVDIEDFKNHFLPKYPTEVEGPIRRLQGLIDARDNDEAKYQQLLQSYPWVLGAQYKRIQRHEKLDDKNIPDFTGVRIHDSCRDIFEIKPPFAKIFRKDGSFTADFYSYWGQAERYLDFARQNQDYLYREKKLRFENPRCYLIIGYGLSSEEMDAFRRKDRMNPLIELRTYNDILVWMKNTTELIKRLSNKD